MALMLLFSIQEERLEGSLCKNIKLARVVLKAITWPDFPRSSSASWRPT
jgi:hypothetical protein